MLGKTPHLESHIHPDNLKVVANHLNNSDRMRQEQLATYLRSHRRNSGLTQRELASVLGYKHEGPVCRHEHAASIPPFFMALAYEAVFRVPASQLFPGFYQTVEQAIEARLAALEIELQTKSAQDRDAKATARKLEWLWARRNGIEISSSS